MPGLVYVTGGRADAIADQVKHINTLKEQFGELVEKLGDWDDRFGWVHRTFPGLITLQVTRKLRCLRGIPSPGRT
ncbi:DNA replication terminus site-binding protein [Marinobacter lipolyticus SM19]|uniref:DNA replication terminus site-binding protein n=1 Tax=Marinobacter lipolyticus SM19 TaxID=1318628 RepID=R8B347_9GAMM|nr:DNA replication terminus site-binding protein [Marinobacter lipolyticus SM19]